MRGQCHHGATDHYHKKSTGLKTKTCNAIKKNMKTGARSGTSRVRCLRQKKSVETSSQSAIPPSCSPQVQCCPATPTHPRAKTDFFFASTWHSTRPTPTTLRCGGQGGHRGSTNVERIFFSQTPDAASTAPCSRLHTFG